MSMRKLMHWAALAGCWVALLASAQETAEEGSGVDAFEAVVKRNIFNPNRGAAPPPPQVKETGQTEEEPPPRRDRIVLNGVMIDGTNAYGFFDGTDAVFRKVVPAQSEIAGLRLVNITSAAVVLAGGTNELVMRVSDELERVGDAPWRVIANEGRSSFQGAATAEGAGSGAAVSSGEATVEAVGGTEPGSAVEDPGMSDVLNRLLEKRRKEEGK